MYCTIYHTLTHTTSHHAMPCHAPSRPRYKTFARPNARFAAIKSPPPIPVHSAMLDESPPQPRRHRRRQHLVPPSSSSSKHLVLKLESLAARRVNGAAAVGPALALVLLLCEALALCDNELGVGPVRVVVRHVRVARQLGQYLDVGLDALEAVLNVVLLLLGLLG